MNMTIIGMTDEEVLNFKDDMNEILMDLQSELYLLRLMEDFGERLRDYSDDVKQRAYDIIRSYQNQHVSELSFNWDLAMSGILGQYTVQAAG